MKKKDSKLKKKNKKNELKKKEKKDWKALLSPCSNDDEKVHTWSCNASTAATAWRGGGKDAGVGDSGGGSTCAIILCVKGWLGW